MQRLLRSEKKKWIHVACQESLSLSCCNFLFFFGQVIKVKAVLKCQWTYTSLVFVPVRGLDYFKCTYKVTRLFLCRTIYSWSPHRHREKEEGDGWEGVDDAAEVGVSKKRKVLTRRYISLLKRFHAYTGCSSKQRWCLFWISRWRRETRIKAVAGRSQGEVAYYAPCGKKLRQYPDVMKVPRPPRAAAVQPISTIQKQMLWDI